MHCTQILGPFPVDKNRSTTGGQSGPSYLQLGPQQEDSPDHANWVAFMSSGGSSCTSTIHPIDTKSCTVRPSIIGKVCKKLKPGLLSGTYPIHKLAVNPYLQ